MSIIIVAAVGFQIALPLRYYLSSDPFDERFAWRMFSGIRVTQCRAMALEESATGQLQSIPLSGSQRGPYGTIHPAWQALIERGRTPVIERFLESRCQRGRPKRVDLVNRCRRPVNRAESSWTDLTWSRLCDTGTVTTPSREKLRSIREGWSGGHLLRGSQLPEPQRRPTNR